METSETARQEWNKASLIVDSEYLDEDLTIVWHQIFARFDKFAGFTGEQAAELASAATIALRAELNKQGWELPE